METQIQLLECSETAHWLSNRLRDTEVRARSGRRPSGVVPDAAASASRRIAKGGSKKSAWVRSRGPSRGSCHRRHGSCCRHRGTRCWGSCCRPRSCLCLLHGSCRPSRGRLSASPSGRSARRTGLCCSRHRRRRRCAAWTRILRSLESPTATCWAVCHCPVKYRDRRPGWVGCGEAAGGGRTAPQASQDEASLVLTAGHMLQAQPGSS